MFLKITKENNEVIQFKRDKTELEVFEFREQVNYINNRITWKNIIGKKYKRKRKVNWIIEQSIVPESSNIIDQILTSLIIKFHTIQHV